MNARSRARLSAATVAALLASMPATPAGAGPRASAADLDGSSWLPKASMAVRTTALGESSRDRAKLGGLTSLDFSGGRFVVAGDEGSDGDTLAGTWSPHPSRPSRFTGVLDEGATQELDDSLEEKLARQFRRELGESATLDFNPREPRVTGRVTRGGQRVKLGVKLRYDATLRYRGAKARLRIVAKINVRGKALVLLD